MKNAAHQYEDKLLEFAYGELPQHEADAVDAHVRGCARCNEALGEIRGVRATMAQLPMEAAPDAGLDSLLAYAEQAAKRNAQGEARPSFFKKFLMPLASVMALATVGVVAWRANQEFDTSPASAAADLKADEYAARAEQEKQQKAQPQQAVPKELQKEQQLEGKGDAPATVAPVAVAAAQPNEEDRAELREQAPKGEQLKQNAAPESLTRRDVTKSKVARESTPVEAPADDWSNVAKRGAVRDNYSDGVQGGAVAKDQAPGRGKTAPVGTRGPVSPPTPDAQASGGEEPAKAPPPEAKKPADKTIGFGLGSGALDADTAVGGLGTAGTGDTTGAYKKRAKTEQKAEPSPAVVATTPAPAAPPPPKPSQSKSSLALPSMRGYSSAPSTGSDEEVAVEKSDAKRLDDDAKFDARRAAAARTKSLEQARVASNRGDRTSEIQLLLQVLKTGATGYEKAEALKRLCDAFEALGEYDTGDRYCDQLLVEFPDTVAAKVVTERRNATQRMPAKTPAAAERKRAVDQLESNKPAEAAPTQAQ